MKTKRGKPLYAGHAVKRIVERRLPVDVISQIAKVGITVQESRRRVMKRGEVCGQAVHVVLQKPNTVITVYFADEWDVAVRRNRKVNVPEHPRFMSEHKRA